MSKLSEKQQDKIEEFFSQLKSVTGEIYWIVEEPEKLIANIEQLLEEEREKAVEEIIREAEGILALPYDDTCQSCIERREYCGDKRCWTDPIKNYLCEKRETLKSVKDKQLKLQEKDDE